MTEEKLMEVERSHDRATIASYFRTFADRLEADGSVTFTTDREGVRLTVPETAGFEVELESETEDDHTEYEIEFEVSWSTDTERAAEKAILEIGSGTEGEQETIDELVEEAEGGEEAMASDDEAAAQQEEGEAGRDPEMQPPDPPEGRSEVDAAEDDQGSQHGEMDTDEKQ